jgi:hypothetical protein
MGSDLSDDTIAMQQAELQMAAEETARAVRYLTGGMTLAQYQPMLGKKKNERVFWVNPQSAEISWDRRGKRYAPRAVLLVTPTPVDLANRLGCPPAAAYRRLHSVLGREGKKANKGPERLRSVSPDIPQFRDAKSWFDEIDVDDSGELDLIELAELYRMARGEKLSNKALKEAMAQMDKDRSGTVGFDEFDTWWKQNTGDLEKKRHLAFTIQTAGTTLLLMAPTASAKRRWIIGITEVLHKQADEDDEDDDDDERVSMDNRRQFRGVVHVPTPAPAPAPEPEPPPPPAPEPEPEPEPEPDPQEVLHELIFGAANTRAEERWSEAAALYGEAIERGIALDIEGTMLSDLYTKKSECHQELQEFDDVLLDLSAAVRLAGNASYPQRRRRATVLMTLGRYPEAKNELELALASCPPHFAESSEIQAELSEAALKVLEMPAVLWPGGPSVSVARFERREAESLFDGPYLEYLLEVAYMSDPAPTVLHKRYSQFQQLFDLLAAEQGCPALPALPAKTWTGKASDTIGLERTKAFHQFLRELGALVRAPESSASWKAAVRSVLEMFLAAPAVPPEPEPEPEPQLSPEEAALEQQIQSGAAMSIQASFRGRKTRRERELAAAKAAEKKRVEEIVAATESERLVKKEETREIQSGAAMSIQASFRGRKTRRERELAAAKAAEKRRVEEIVAATESERLVKKQMKEKEEARVEHKKQTVAATTVQAAARGRNTRREMEARDEAARRVQAAARGHTVRSEMRRDKAAAAASAQRENAAAVRMQAAARGHSTRKKAMIERIMAEDEMEEAAERDAAAAEEERLLRLKKMAAHAIETAGEPSNAEAGGEEGSSATTVNTTFKTLKKVQDKWTSKSGGMTMKAMRAQSRGNQADTAQPDEEPVKPAKKGVSWASVSDDEDSDEDEVEEQRSAAAAAAAPGGGPIDIRQPVTYAEELGVSATDAAQLQDMDAQLEETEARLLRAKRAEADRVAQLEQAQLEADQLLQRLQRELGTLSSSSIANEGALGAPPAATSSLTQPLPSPSGSRFENMTGPGSLASLHDELSQVRRMPTVRETP